MKSPKKKKTKEEYRLEADDYINRIQQFLGGDINRGNRANVKRYWSETTRHSAYPIMGRLGAIDSKPKTIVVGLYAIHPETIDDVSVGKAAFKLKDKTFKLSDTNTHPYEAHFKRLLASSDLDDLEQQLYRLVRRMETARPTVDLDFADLYQKLILWNNGYSESVKRGWALDFWQSKDADQTQEGDEA